MSLERMSPPAGHEALASVEGTGIGQEIRGTVMSILDPFDTAKELLGVGGGSEFLKS